VGTFGQEAIAYRTVTKYLREAQINPGDPTASPDAFSPHIDDSDEAILSAIEELPFSSVRKLSRATQLSNTTLYRRLSEKLGFLARHLRWVPDIVSGEQKATRVKCSRSLLMILRA
jgi:hypothetical protein